MTDEQLKKFWARIYVAETGCWLWQGALLSKGYGCFEKHTYAHVASYEHYIGPIPFGKILHHECEVFNCANPLDVKPVSRGDHTRIHRFRPCPQGHPPVPENVFYNVRGQRQCLICKRNRDTEGRRVRGIPPRHQSPEDEI